MKKTLSAILAALAFTGPAWAQGNCTSSVDMIGTLSGKYGEATMLHALTPQGNVLHLWSNPETGTWSITVTFPDGRSCIHIAGKEGIEMHAAPAEGDDT